MPPQTADLSQFGPPEPLVGQSGAALSSFGPPEPLHSMGGAGGSWTPPTGPSTILSQKGPSALERAPLPVEPAPATPGLDSPPKSGFKSPIDILYSLKSTFGGEDPALHISPAEMKAIVARYGNPNNLHGIGMTGKLQASFYAAQDSMRDASQRPTNTKPLSPMLYSSTGVIADALGILGGLSTKGNMSAGAVASLVPWMRLPIAAFYAGESLYSVFKPRMSQESWNDYGERLGEAVGGTLLAGSVGAKEVPGAIKSVQDFRGRLQAATDADNALVGAVQGKIMPKLHMLHQAMKADVDAAVSSIVDADKGANPAMKQTVFLSKTMPEVNSGPALEGNGTVQNIVQDLRDAAKTGANPAGRVNASSPLGRAPGAWPFDFEAAKNLRTQIGAEAAKAYRMGQMPIASYLGRIYEGLTGDMKTRANELAQTEAFDKYNGVSKMYHDLQRNAHFGSLLDGRLDPDGIRRVFKSDLAAVEAGKDIGAQAGKLTKPMMADARQVTGWLDKFGIDKEPWVDSLKEANTLTRASDQMHKDIGATLYRVVTQGFTKPALLAMGVYLMAHGVGIGGFAPYLLATLAASSMNPLQLRIEAGAITRRLGTELPPGAFKTMYETEPFGSYLPKTPAPEGGPPPQEPEEEEPEIPAGPEEFPDLPERRAMDIKAIKEGRASHAGEGTSAAMLTAGEAPKTSPEQLEQSHTHDILRLEKIASSPDTPAEEKAYALKAIRASKELRSGAQK